ASPADRDLAFEAQTVKLAGVVVDEHGAPLQDARVSVTSPLYGHVPEDQSSSSTRLQSGRFEFFLPRSAYPGAAIVAVQDIHSPRTFLCGIVPTHSEHVLRVTGRGHPDHQPILGRLTCEESIEK